MSYQDRIDIDRLYDLIYDTKSEQLKVVTREEFEQLFGSISSFKDMQDLYYDKSEVYLKIVEVLKEAGVITEDTYNELIAKIQTAQNTADLADTKATNAVGTANNAQTSATNALNGVDRIDGEIGDTSTQGTIKYDVNQAKTQSSQAIQDSSVAKQDSSQALTNSNNALDGVDDIRDEIGNATTPNTIKYDVFNAKSNSTEALSKSNQAISDSSDALDLAETVDGKADNLRTDVGTVNQSTDGSLQEQITYLPSYISKLQVESDSSGALTTNKAQFKLNDNGYMKVEPSELGKKVMRDGGSITYVLTVTRPDGSVSSYNHTISQGVTIIRSIRFTQKGVYVIACESLKCVILVGEYADAIHTHTVDEITDYPEIKWETPSDVSGITMGSFEVCKALRLAHWKGSKPMQIKSGLNQLPDKVNPYYPSHPITQVIDHGGENYDVVTMTVGNNDTYLISPVGMALTLRWDIFWIY